MPSTDVREMWLTLCGAVNAAEEEIGRRIGRLLELAGVAPQDAGDGNGDWLAAVRQHVRKNRLALEKRVEDEVRAALARVGAPLEREVASLRARIEEVSKRVEALKATTNARK